MKKRFISMVLAAAMTLTLIPATALADDDDSLTSGSLTYELSDDDDDDAYTAALKRCRTSAEGGITIPSSVSKNGKTYKVTSIEDEAFADCKSITSVVIPSSIKEIDEEAFADCKKLSKVTFKGNAPEIEDDSFEHVTATAVYPSGNKTWTSDVRKNYGGKLTWKASESSSSSTFSTPKLGSISNASSGITVKWSKVSSASGYYVYRKTSDSGWKKIAAVKDASKTSYTDKSDALKSGTTYTYTVKAYKGDKTTGYDKTGLSIKRLSKPSISVKNTASGINVKWKKVTGASGYYVYRKDLDDDDDNNYHKIATVKDALTWTDKKAENGEEYAYTVKAYSGKSVSTSASGKIMIRLTRPELKSLKAVSGLKMKASWSENDDAEGYRLQYAANKDFENAKSIYLDDDDETKTISKLTKGKKYYVRVCAYEEEDDVKYYSAWSNVKSVTISK